MFGAGWVGLVTGACFAELGHEVVVRDVIPERIEALRAGSLPLHEPGLAELLERNRERLTFTTELDEVVSAPIMFVCVGTPPTYSGDADLSAVWTVVDHLPALEERAILVMKSTVPVGTGEKVRAALDARGLAHVGYVSNPEFLSEGSAVEDFMHPDRIVVGSFTEADAGTVVSLYEPLEAPIVRADVASAEMIKLAANAFLMTRISFINEIANVCEATGADVEQVAKGIGLDHRLGPHFLRAGIGWGGSCFPKDGVALKQLASNSGYHFQLLSAVIEVNELQKRRVIGKLEKHLGKLRGKTIALLGLAFKPNTDDLREAPSLVLASRLLAEGADVRTWDPVADASHLLQGVEFLRQRPRCSDRSGCRSDRDRVGRAEDACLRRGARCHAPAADPGRPQLPRPGAGPRGRLRLRGDRPRRLAAGFPPRDRGARAPARSVVEAVILAGGKAERLGDAAAGRPKALVEVGGRPLAAYQVEQLAAAGVERVLVSCAAGQEEQFAAALGGLGPGDRHRPRRRAARPRRGHPLRGDDAAGGGRPLRAERRRARRRRPAASSWSCTGAAAEQRRSPSCRCVRHSGSSSSRTTS